MRTLFSIIVALFLFVGCSTEGANVPVHKNSATKTLNSDEIKMLIVGKRLTVPEFKGEISYFSDGRYSYKRPTSIFNSRYKIVGNSVCVETGLSANILELEGRYYWNNVSSREFISVISNIEELAEESGGQSGGQSG